MVLWTYSARLCSEWLRDRGLRYDPHNARVGGFNLAQHGLRVEFTHPGDPEKKLYMSIQTHPLVASDAFAETAMQSGSELLSSMALKSPDCVRHRSPEDLFAYVNMVAGILQDGDAFQRILDGA